MAIHDRYTPRSMEKLAFNIVIISVVLALALDRCSAASPSAPSIADPPGENQIAAPQPIAPASTFIPAGTVILDRAPDGHFRADGTINGTAQRFLVDTGASTVALGRTEARRVGLFVSDSDFTSTAETAAGPVKVASVLIPRMTVGSISATNVRATVVDMPSLPPLLGQSFLSQLSDVTIRGDRMALR